MWDVGCVFQDEKFDSSGPSISELVSKENVDKLSYMGWLVDQAADPKKVLSNALIGDKEIDICIN